MKLFRYLDVHENIMQSLDQVPSNFNSKVITRKTAKTTKNGICSSKENVESCFYSLLCFQITAKISKITKGIQGDLILTFYSLSKDINVLM